MCFTLPMGTFLVFMRPFGSRRSLFRLLQVNAVIPQTGSNSIKASQQSASQNHLLKNAKRHVWAPQETVHKAAFHASSPLPSFPSNKDQRRVARSQRPEDETVTHIASPPRGAGLLIRATTGGGGGGHLFPPLTSVVQTRLRSGGDINTDDDTPPLRGHIHVQSDASRDDNSSPNGQQRGVETEGGRLRK